MTATVETNEWKTKDMKKDRSTPSIRHCFPLEEIRIDNVPKFGGKTASLGEMIRELSSLGVRVPGGFGVSTSAYDALLDTGTLRENLREILKDVNGKPNRVSEANASWGKGAWKLRADIYI
jgi:phosphoenolpyruvate synthase/pyruvate phosphate dikinase